MTIAVVAIVGVGCAPAEQEVWFVAGQSNAANVSLREGVPPATNVTREDGVHAASPFPDGGGEGFNAFEAVAGAYGRPVVVAVHAVPGWTIAQLAPGVVAAAQRVRDRWGHIDHFVWQQGEADAYLHTDPGEYTVRFSLMAAGVGARATHVARSTMCLAPYDNPIGQAQDALRLRYPGPDTDLVWPRADGCHFTGDQLVAPWLPYLR